MLIYNELSIGVACFGVGSFGGASEASSTENELLRSFWI